MSDKLTYLYLRLRNEARSILTGAESEGGMSKLAVTVILLAVAVALTLAVVAIIAPEILGLAEETGKSIRDVNLDFGE